MQIKVFGIFLEYSSGSGGYTHLWRWTYRIPVNSNKIYAH